jgi:hypothetical protein
MANPKDTMMEGMKEVAIATNVKAIEDYPAQEGPIAELISRAFTTRNLAHFAHWASKSYAEHEALGGLYDEIVTQIDEIVEVYQGKFGLLQSLSTGVSEVPRFITAHVKEEAEWIRENKEKIANGNAAIANLIDELDAAYLKVIYKLENLK